LLSYYTFIVLVYVRIYYLVPIS